MTGYRGRFAPSPTGPLHFGSLVGALASWLDARAHGGAWLVRIEDLDGPRTVPGAADDILATLAHFGMTPDEPPVWQSTRDAAYTAALERLVAAGPSIRAAARARKSPIRCAPRTSAIRRSRTGHLPHRPARQARARVAAARAGRRRRDRHVRRSLAAHAITEPRDRSRRFRAEARGRPMGLPARGRRRRCRCAHHARRARR